MDKSIVLALLPVFALILLVGVLVLHIRQGKSVDVRLKGFGIELKIHSEDKLNDKNGVDSSETT